MLTALFLSAALAQSPAPSLPEKWRCPVSVDRVLEDNRYRGHRSTPAHLTWVESLTPDMYQMYIAESHGESYRQCSYAVTASGKHWTFTTAWSTTFTELPTGWCEHAREEVTVQIQRVTRGCTDLHAGAWTGHDLVPRTAAD